MSRPYRQILIQLGLAESQWLSGDAACLVEDEVLKTIVPTTELWRNQNELALNSQRQAPIIQQSTWNDQPPAHRKQGLSTLAKVTWHSRELVTTPTANQRRNPSQNKVLRTVPTMNPRIKPSQNKEHTPQWLPEHRVPVLIAGPMDTPSTPLATLCDHRILLAVHQSGMDPTVQSYMNLGIEPVLVVESESDKVFQSGRVDADAVFRDVQSTTASFQNLARVGGTIHMFTATCDVVLTRNCETAESTTGA
eukprot:scaffold61949_cov66-Attheya_sp.AAC.2